MAGPAIKLENVAKAFADNRVLRGIDLDVPAGGSVVVIGPSGTGKTVLLKTLIGVHTPDSGKMSVDGTEVSAEVRVFKDEVLAPKVVLGQDSFVACHRAKTEKSFFHGGS